MPPSRKTMSNRTNSHIEMNMRGVKIPLAKPNIGDEELDAVRKVFESGMVAGGKVTEKFEEEFAKYLGVKYAIATTSCTTALNLALLSLGIKQGDEVIIPDFTYPATGNVVFHVGARPILVDIDIMTYNVDPSAIESGITRRTKAIIPVHLFGQSADMKPIMKIAERHNLFVIEDAACGAGSSYEGKKIVTFGDVACFSFHGRKTLTTGEGGMLVTNIKAVAEKARILKNDGIKIISGKSCFVCPGYNFRLSNILSSIGLVQLKKLDAMIQRKIELANNYDEILHDLRAVKTPIKVNNAKHNYQSYCILIEKDGKRDNIILKLSLKGIETQIGTYALHVQPQYLKGNYTRGDLTSSTRAYMNTLALPMYDTLTRAELEYICKNLKMCF